MLIGLAIGDALGAAVEFKAPGTFPPVECYRAGGPHGLNPGEWTDDTSMALALADSIATVGWDLNDQAERYLSWLNRGTYSVNGICFDKGSTVWSALRRFEKTRDAWTSGSILDKDSGNGSIMRLAPVAIAYADYYPERIDDLIARACESSIPTHGSDKCKAACAYLAVILTALCQGTPRETVLSAKWSALEGLQKESWFDPAVANVVAGSYRNKSAQEIRGTGYVVESLEAALWSFYEASSFEEAVLNAVNLGYDADSTGAVCGQLAGAYWGESGIPEAWIQGLQRRDMIEDTLKRIIN